MAELCRVARVAVRSTSLLRSSTSRWPSCALPIVSASATARIRQISTTPIFRSVQDSDRPTYPYPSWSNPSRDRRPTPTEDGEIKKPDTSAYKESSADDEKPANTSTFQDPLDDDFDFSDDLNFEISELSKTRAASEHQPPERPILRLVPRTGRTVHVGRNVDVARSFKLLALQIAQNKLRQDFQRQRFHERPGLKRKRLKSQRWQKRFKIGFKEAIKRVKELTRQGW